ncbi:MAG TPA: hypothetical protein VGN14_02830 [Candidatus Elarobacter sp.]|jgi:hypothetical protein
MRTSAAVLLGALLTFSASAAFAQTAPPAPSPSPAPLTFTALSHADVTFTTPNAVFTGNGKFGVSAAPGFVRVDVLSLTTPVFTLPPMRATLLIDRRAGTVTIWNDTTKRYYTQPLMPHLGGSSPSPSPRPSPSRRPVPRGTPGVSPLRDLEVLDVSLHLTGHTTTVGQPSTGLAFSLTVRRRTDAAESHVTATTQLADDFAAFPLTIEASVEPGTSPFSAKLSYAVDSLQRGDVPAATFRIPAGYTRATSVMDVVSSRR